MIKKDSESQRGQGTANHAFYVRKQQASGAKGDIGSSAAGLTLINND